MYNLPIWLRRFHIHEINQHHQNHQEEIDRQSKQNSNIPDKGPNLPPSDIFNYNAE